MSLQVRCPKCGNVAQLPESAAGKTVRCNDCSTHITIATSAPPEVKKDELALQSAPVGQPEPSGTTHQTPRQDGQNAPVGQTQIHINAWHALVVSLVILAALFLGLFVMFSKDGDEQQAKEPGENASATEKAPSPERNLAPDQESATKRASTPKKETVTRKVVATPDGKAKSVVLVVKGNARLKGLNARIDNELLLLVPKDLRVNELYERYMKATTELTKINKRIEEHIGLTKRVCYWSRESKNNKRARADRIAMVKKHKLQVAASSTWVEEARPYTVEVNSVCSAMLSLAETGEGVSMTKTDSNGKFECHPTEARKHYLFLHCKSPDVNACWFLPITVRGKHSLSLSVAKAFVQKNLSPDLVSAHNAFQKAMDALGISEP